MAKKQKTTPTATHWRDLKKKTAPKPISWRARLRAWWVWTKRIFFVALVGALGYLAYYAYQNIYFNEIFATDSKPINRIEFKTDGVISGEWLNSYLKIKSGTKLADVNIFELKQMLDLLSQIKTSQVERKYPDTLRITIAEHKPFAKVLLQVDYQNRIYAISEDGFFFAPISFDNETLDDLKYIEGIKITFKGRVPAQYKSMPKLVKFMNVVKTRIPKEFKNWHSINVSEIDSITLPLITIKNKNGIKYIFKPSEYDRQIDRLEYILSYMKENPIDNIEKIDLSLKESSIVKIAKPKTK